MTDASKSHLIHGRFAPLAAKIAQVKSWPEVIPEDVDAAVALAAENGTIAGYEAEFKGNLLLDVVITVNRESVPATLVYARDRMQEAHGHDYWYQDIVYADDVVEQHVKLLPWSWPFMPNRIVVEVVDLGANWNRSVGVIGREVQTFGDGNGPLAHFSALYAASQSPEWVRQMDGTAEKVPYVAVGGLLTSVPNYPVWSHMPSISHDGNRALLDSIRIGYRLFNHSLPVLREYPR